MSTEFRFHSKTFLAFVGSLMLMISGIIIILTFVWLPSQMPTEALVYTYKAHLIVAGALLILISLAPLIVALNAANFQLRFLKRWHAQTHHELHYVLGLCGCTLGLFISDADSLASERIFYKRTERFMMEMEELPDDWDGLAVPQIPSKTAGKLPFPTEEIRNGVFREQI